MKKHKVRSQMMRVGIPAWMGTLKLDFKLLIQMISWHRLNVFFLQTHFQNSGYDIKMFDNLQAKMLP